MDGAIPSIGIQAINSWISSNQIHPNGPWAQDEENACGTKHATAGRRARTCLADWLHSKFWIISDDSIVFCERE